jgi:hypothetical protein
MSALPVQTRSQKSPHPHPPPHFAMFMQITVLQRSVVDRYATKGLNPKNQTSPTRAITHFQSLTSQAHEIRSVNENIVIPEFPSKFV